MKKHTLTKQLVENERCSVPVSQAHSSANVLLILDRYATTQGTLSSQSQQ